jgi:hypothetical protein
MAEQETRIHLAFRFHANYYHSYRGDTPDELGFGKDIRIIRRIIEILDNFNAQGVPACGTWDIENYFSLEKIMPAHCPDIIESLRRRVAEGRDEVQVMSYNNGLVSAHTAAEFDAAVGRAVSNAAGSGLQDLFPSFAPMVRPQEMMYTPIHLKLYPRHGIDCISLFHSAVPFNAFSNFIRPLPFEQSYNPLKLTSPGIDETMTLVPARNHGDRADNVSLRWWLKRLRRKQLAMAEPKDLLLLIDADADDEYWYGFNWPVVSTVLAAARGLHGLIDSVRDLDFLTFTTPGEYVKTHPPLGTIVIGQDTADGSFDGLSSWAEKWSNHQLWTAIERARILELQARRLVEAGGSGEHRDTIEKLLAGSFEARLRALSTTHFGLSSPVMNVTRIKTGIALLDTAMETATGALDLATRPVAAEQKEIADEAAFSLFDYVRGISTKTVSYSAKPSRALVRVPVSVPELTRDGAALLGADGSTVPSAFRREDGASEVLFVETVSGGERKDYRIKFSGASAEQHVDKPASVAERVIENGRLKLRFDSAMQPVSLSLEGLDLADGAFMRSAINYSDRVSEVSRWKTLQAMTLGGGLLACMTLSGEIPLAPGGKVCVSVEREFMLAAELPYLYVTTRVAYPKTRSKNFKKNLAHRLQQEYDGNWREVMPVEIRPALFGKRGSPLRVWKHNHCGHTSCYDLDYGEYSKNTQLDSFNNHITHAWVAVTNRRKGLLVAQTADATASHAFCPMRTRETEEGSRIFMNPFGSYHGSQLSYVTAFTGLGKLISLKMAEHIDSFAPSYNGRTETISLLIAPYVGDEPPQDIRNDAEAFAYPYAVVSNSKHVTAPPHRAWSFPAPLAVLGDERGT